MAPGTYSDGRYTNLLYGGTTTLCAQQVTPVSAYCNGVAVGDAPKKEYEPPPAGWHQLFGGFAYRQDKPRPPKRQIISHRIGTRRKFK